MRILISTNLTQGDRGNDFCHVPEGEILGFTSECDGEPVDGKCGCRRSMRGILSHRATTTMKVVDIDITKEGLSRAILNSYQSIDGAKDSQDPKDRKLAGEDAEELIHIAASLPIGAIIEKRGNRFRVRSGCY
jgi:hypothetical protein